MAITDYTTPITGIPDPAEFGDISSLPKGQVLPMVIQRHEARKAGLHRDVRIGKGQMFSWATKKQGLPMPGELQAIFQTPLHEESYMHYAGELPRGMYGAGKVAPQEKGSVVVHKATPDQVVFTTAHTRYPQTYVMIRTGNKPTDWLVKNLTPKSLEEFAGPGVSFEKEHYKSVPSSGIGNLYGPQHTFAEKIDGARMLLKLRRHAVEAASYRPSATGEPIMHTSRLQLPRDIEIPPKLVGSTLVGEAWGEKAATYHGSHSAKIRLRELLKNTCFDKPTPHTGRDASGMLTGSDAARAVQIGKQGEVKEDTLPWYKDPEDLRYKAMRWHIERNKKNILGPAKMPNWENDPWWIKEEWNPFHFPLVSFRGRPGTPAEASQITYDLHTKKRVLSGAAQGTFDYSAPGRPGNPLLRGYRGFNHWLFDIVPHWITDQYMDEQFDPKSYPLLKDYTKAVAEQKAGEMAKAAGLTPAEEATGLRGFSLVAKEIAEEVPLIWQRYQRAKKEQEQPQAAKPVLPMLPKITPEKEPAAGTAPTSKVATAIGTVEPIVAKNPLALQELMPKGVKLKPMKPDTRSLLNDKVADEHSYMARHMLKLLKRRDPGMLSRLKVSPGAPKVQVQEAIRQTLPKTFVGKEEPGYLYRATKGNILSDSGVANLPAVEVGAGQQRKDLLWMAPSAGGVYPYAYPEANRNLFRMRVPKELHDVPVQLADSGAESALMGVSADAGAAPVSSLGKYNPSHPEREFHEVVLNKARMQDYLGKNPHVVEQLPPTARERLAGAPGSFGVMRSPSGDILSSSIPVNPSLFHQNPSIRPGYKAQAQQKVAAHSEAHKNYANYIQLFQRALGTKHYNRVILGRTPGGPVYLFQPKDMTGKRVLVISGQHGEEPGGPWALLRAIHNSKKPIEDLSVSFLPVGNPYGFKTGQRCGFDRKSTNWLMDSKGELRTDGECVKILTKNIDLLKKCSRDGLLNVHEDVTSKGFYLYVNGDVKQPIVKTMLKQGKKWFDFKKDGEYHDNETYTIKDGLVDNHKDGTIDQYLYDNGAPLAITMELPAKSATMFSRIHMGAALIRMFLTGLAGGLAKKSHDGSFKASTESDVEGMDITFGLDTKRLKPEEIRKAINEGKMKGVCTMKHVVKKADAVPVQELSGLLNSSLAESLRKQKEQKINMRVALFNVLSKGKTPVGPEVPYKERQLMMQEILKHLPPEKFHLAETATTPETQKAMWEKIQAGKNPRTSEGVVVWPETGVPTKVKIMPEYDAIIRNMFPGEGKYNGTGVGGFEYSLPGTENVVGKVGTGLSDELRKQMHENPEQFVGRVARVHAMGQYPSGAYRAPALLALHEG